MKGEQKSWQTFYVRKEFGPDLRVPGTRCRVPGVGCISGLCVDYLDNTRLVEKLLFGYRTGSERARGKGYDSVTP